jgi:hypothetical protein
VAEGGGAGGGVAGVGSEGGGVAGGGVASGGVACNGESGGGVTGDAVASGGVAVPGDSNSGGSAGCLAWEKNRVEDGGGAKPVWVAKAKAMNLGWVAGIGRFQCSAVEIASRPAEVPIHFSVFLFFSWVEERSQVMAQAVQAAASGPEPLTQR